MKKTCNKCKAVLDGIMIFHPDTCLSCVIDIHMKEYQNRIKKVKKAINEKGLLKIIQLGRIPQIVPD